MEKNFKKQGFCQILNSDIRFGLPDILNDQSWELGTGINQPDALSLATTYGLRASRMHIFPEFSIETQSVKAPEDFHTFPDIDFSSTNFALVTFSPFPSIDVEFRVWVPTSQALVGEITCTNTNQTIITLGVDWLVQLFPLKNGSSMKNLQIGLNTVLQGECDDLFPVFYLTGGAYPSTSAFPGLGTKMLLLPASKKQITWVMGSFTSIEASLQQARQYSSKALEVEQLKIEMADKREKVFYVTGKPATSRALEISQNCAYQMVMPPIRKFAHPTYVSSRNSSTGNCHNADLLEVYPEWTGQTLPEIWMLAQSLLPGRPDIIKGFLQNFLAEQQPNGKIDYRVSPNGNHTGHLSLPILSSLVVDLHPYLDDPQWLEEIYPCLISFLKTWVSLRESGELILTELTHPIQLGFSSPDPLAGTTLTDLWIRLKSSNNLFILSLLLRETSDLLQIARGLEKIEDWGWLEKIRGQLLSSLNKLWDERTGTFTQLDMSTGQPHGGKIVGSFKKNGTHKPKRKLPAPGRIYLRINCEGRFPQDFSCRIMGTGVDGPEQLTIRLRDLQSLGQSYIFVSSRAFSTIESIEILGLPGGAYGEIGQADLMQKDITQLLTLYAGVPTTRQAEQLLKSIRVKNHIGIKGLSLLAYSEENPVIVAPGYIAGMIVEGLLRYGKISLSAQVFNHHFIDRIFSNDAKLNAMRTCSIKNLEDLTPVRLFLKINGVVKLTSKEVIISHFIKKSQDTLTVKYNKVEMVLKRNITEIHTQAGEIIYMNKPGPNRVILD